jgi:hypothetical protein
MVDVASVFCIVIDRYCVLGCVVHLAIITCLVLPRERALVSLPSYRVSRVFLRVKALEKQS